MGYFNYHAKVKRKIKEIGVESVEIKEVYHGISPAMIITLKNKEVYPIREHKFLEYMSLIDNLDDFGG